MRFLATAILVAFMAAAGGSAQAATGIDKSGAAAPTLISPDGIRWKPEMVNGHPTGASIAVIAGDPDKSDRWIIRYKMPSHFHIAPHQNGYIQSAVVLQGDFILGFGHTADSAKERRMGTGSYLVMPKGVWHYSSTEGVTILQVAGGGCR